ncbi:hypothetical protein [Nonomuraea zeae]|uniref:Uncharacterized protein n=1 Tax=Nonomuraea zeae TaxID=1642303 RepID=A0A5S4GP68_9ACTN|nr:hypothetical protein [Nonomuraea zeae]TMR34746.1 hypothetical protein ETD85_15830 [Nonomuraea zeae]
MLLVQVCLPPGATLADALHLLDVSPEEADAGFGLVSVAPGVHVLRVTEQAAAKLDRDLCQVFSDPPIEPTT